jgi:uncharacterized tellurite resistance protein B-like protein
MDLEISVFLGLFSVFFAIVWFVVARLSRDADDSGVPPAMSGEVEADGVAGVTPSSPATSSDASAPKLKLSTPGPVRTPLPLSAIRTADESGPAPQFALKTEPAILLLPSGYALHGVSVLGRGPVPPAAAEGHRFVFHVVDFENGVEGPLYCPVPGFGDPLLGMVRYVPDAESPPPRQFADWTKLAFLPTSMFVGPRSGLRTLSLRCGFMPTDGDPAKCVHLGAALFKVNLELPGFLEELDLKILVSTHILELALACAAADGDTDVREKDVIREWIEQVCASVAMAGSECEDRLRSALSQTLSSSKRSPLDVESAALALQTHAEGRRMEAMSLCVRVIASDGILHEKEMRMAERLADLLQIDRSIMRTLFDRQFATSGIAVSPENLEAIVGLDPSWQKDKIRRHLADQFMKWNSRAPAAKTVEDQARIRAMLDAIAKLKHKYA